MKFRFVTAFFCFYSMTANAILPDDFSFREYSDVMLLLSQSDFDVRMGAKSLYRQDSPRRFVLDLLAEVTWTACSGKRKMDIDTLSWLGKSLGQSKQVRYAELLNYCLANASDSKTKKYLEKALDNIEGRVTKSFGAGILNLEEIRASMPIRGNTAYDKEAVRQFSEVRIGATLDDIYNSFGFPDSVRGSSLPKGRAGSHFFGISVSEDLLVFTYSNLGSFRFGFDKTKSDWLLVEAASINKFQWVNHHKRIVSFSGLHTASDGMELRKFARLLINQGNIGVADLDTIAEKIYWSRQDLRNKMPDGLGWLCNVLIKSRDGRYKQVMHDVATSPDTSRRLKKYARKAAKKLPAGSSNIFVPSSQIDD